MFSSCAEAFGRRRASQYHAGRRTFRERVPHRSTNASRPGISVSATIERLEERRLLSSATLTTLAAFNGTNGAGPTDVVADANGNLFGVTNDSVVSGQQGPGELFEIPAGTTTIKVLATFSNNDYFGGSLVIDSAGNLYGTENGETGSNLPGIVFEVEAGTSTITPLATFPSYQGTIGTKQMTGTVTAVDSGGNVFGVDGLGNPFEVVKGSGAVTYLTQVQNGSGPIDASDLVVGPGGNLYGTTFDDGDNSAGSIFEIPAGTTNLETLASFDASTTGSKPLGIVFDSSGNLFGFCENGGSGGNGTVFELASGSTTLALLGSFTSATGENPVSRPVLDSSGDLYGFTETGGANGYGTFFGISTAGGGVEDLSDLGSNLVAGQFEEGLVTNAAGQPFIPPSATAAVSSIRPDDALTNAIDLWWFATGNTPNHSGIFSALLYGIIYIYGPQGSAPSAPIPQNPANSKGTLKDLGNELKNEIIEETKAQEQAQKGGGKSIVRPDISGNAAEFKQLKQMLNQIKSELSHATTELNTATRFYNSYNTETATITRLQTQLAAQSKPAVEARLQKQITADQTAQNKDANTDNTDCDSAVANLDEATSGEASVQTELNSIT